MRSIISTLVCILIFQTLHAQPYPQLRLKTGYSFLFPSPGARGYAFKTVPQNPGSLVLGVEYSHPFKKKKAAWHVGFTFQDSKNSPAPNEKNLNPINLVPQTASFTGSPTKTVIYAGIEKFINRNDLKPSKNYFSVFGGIGLAFTLNKFEDWKFAKPQKYETRNGGIVEGYLSEFQRPSFPVSPSVYGGLRYNITNKKGNEVFIIELAGNFGLTPYYRQTIGYTLDGVVKQDRLKEKGSCLQLNLIIPLHTFGKRRH